MTGTQDLLELTERQRAAARAILRDCGFSSADHVRAVVRRIELESARVDVDAIIGGTEE